MVVSSSWRLRYDLDELNAMLAERGATFRASATTPRVTEHDPSRPLRAREVLAYVDNLPAPPEALAVLDDGDLGGLVPGHLKLDGTLVLQERHVEECVKMLTRSWWGS